VAVHLSILPSFHNVYKMDIDQISKMPEFKDVPRATLSSIFSTNNLMYSFVNKAPGLQKKEFLFIPDTLSLLFVGSGDPADSPDKILSSDQLSSFRTFVRSAQDLASANACTSVLAGQGSEGDEYGDVGLMLGKDTGKAIEESTDAQGKAKAVLSALYMDHLLSQASDPSTLVSELELSEETGLPTFFKCKPSDPLLAKFKEAQTNLGLTTPFAFSVDCSALQGGIVFHFLLGRVQGDKPASSSAGNQTSWIGLFGVGIWS